MSDEDDPASRVRAVLLSGIAAIENRMVILAGKPKRNAGEMREIIALTKDAATVLSHVRRYDAAMRDASRALSAAVVITWLRALPPERLRPILAEVSEEPDEAAEGSVLS